MSRRHWIVLGRVKVRVPRRVQRWWEFSRWYSVTLSEYNHVRVHRAAARRSGATSTATEAVDQVSDAYSQFTAVVNKAVSGGGGTEEGTP